MYFELYKKIPEFKLQNYDMSIQEFKVIFWWEWGHRFLGRLIGISYLIPLLYFSFKLKFKNLLSLYFIFLLIDFFLTNHQQEILSRLVNSTFYRSAAQ